MTLTDPQAAASPRIPQLVRQGAVGLLFAVILLVLAVETVLRQSAVNLAGDAILQSVMSVQHVEWFYWGQNRFASVVPLLARPVADPMANLMTIQILNALSFYGLLLLLAAMATPVLSDRRGWPRVLVVFLAIAAVAQLILKPLPLYFVALDAQPYSLSWLLGLGSYLLWRRSRWWEFTAAGALAWIAIGLNPSVVVGIGALALVEMIRRRQWIRWPVFGVGWLLGLVSWMVIAARYPADNGPFPASEPDYFAFRVDLFQADAGKSLDAIRSGLHQGLTLALAVLAVLCLLAVSAKVRTALLIRLAFLAGFAVIYWVVFTGNPWVSANGSAIRYFFPVLIIVILGLATPTAGALLAIRAPVALPIAVTATVCAVASIGPQTPLSDAPTISQVEAAVADARANGIHYVAGNYWSVWPVVHGMLADGRLAAFGTALRSEAAPGTARRWFDDDLAAGRRPRAICLNDSTDSCVTYLNYWTAPGWSTTAVATCVAPPLGADPGTCEVLEFDAAAPR